MLRLQSDERLVALTRKGNHAAFETLCSRYQSRLLSFCRHMLASKEDAEDVLQEVFTAAFNAVLADDREINVKPWLYRIARNRSLNHLRRASAVGVDSMDIHFSENGISTSDKVLRRESFRELIGDVHELPETQRTALLLREIDALSYDQIALAMDTTVPSVKSLLVRARISLAEAAEARKLSCEQVRLELGEAAEGLTKLSTPARRHVRGCERCLFFKKQLRDNNKALAAILPIGPFLIIKKILAAKLGSAGGAHVAGGVSVGAGATAGAAVTSGGASVAGGLLTAGAGAIATKAVAGLAAAAIVAAGAVAADHAVSPVRHHHAPAAAVYASNYSPVQAPVVARQIEQPATPTSPSSGHAAAAAARHRLADKRAAALKAAAAKPVVTTVSAATTPPPVTATPVTPPPAAPPTPQVTEVTTEGTALPTSATETTATTTPPPTTTTTTTSPETTATTPPATTTTPAPTGPPSTLPSATPIPTPVTPPSTGGTSAPK
jgi:RNA polymerase sigma factor (sigma-70 family)